MSNIEKIGPSINRVESKNRKKYNKEEKKDKSNKNSRNENDLNGKSQNGYQQQMEFQSEILSEKEILEKINELNNDPFFKNKKIFFTYDESSSKRPIEVRLVETRLAIQKMNLGQFISLIRNKDFSKIGQLINILC